MDATQTAENSGRDRAGAEPGEGGARPEPTGPEPTGPAPAAAVPAQAAAVQEALPLDGLPEQAELDRARRPTGLSPSRASDFMTCPLMYRFRVIDRLPEEPSSAATRGTLVHAVLERIFDAPIGSRTVERARSLLRPRWDALLAERPELAGLFPRGMDGAEFVEWLASAEKLVERWFELEDPNRLEPAEREVRVQATLPSGLALRGYIDRIDVAPGSGDLRVVDYKTGKAPRPGFEAQALFQMKFYALVLWRLRGRVPRRLQLVYLGSGDVLTHDPHEGELLAVERKLQALWEAITEATASGRFEATPNKLCGWCGFQANCPEFGGSPPPFPLPVRKNAPGPVPVTLTTAGAARQGGAGTAADHGGTRPDGGRS
ncbi:RecB family exonuclease [Allostreptomyces psammosilenae]|uniref:Putative RecB family exonuclease n=1 Tax=Allostreptomyces psammosilenae TaxID=1892865 RepID=A0A852ZNK5_9ACTN|nr:PD-(D/E)XK nuclease family protein [Allostreptomyces psammosilenae]NYI03979.1 putative RecB family exonuclease [Allostreptomyces psammosilenae]